VSQDERHDWPMYGRNLAHTFSSRTSAITERNVSSLKLRWTFVTGDAVTASPAVVDGVVYVGAWDGFFYALDAATGALKWKFQLDCQPSVVPLPQVCGGPHQELPRQLGFKLPAASSSPPPRSSMTACTLVGDASSTAWPGTMGT
jgi:glucose dehydrogenase